MVCLIKITNTKTQEEFQSKDFDLLEGAKDKEKERRKEGREGGLERKGGKGGRRKAQTINQRVPRPPSQLQLIY